MGNAHVKDVARAVITVLKAALEGKADEGAEGYCESQRDLLTKSLGVLILFLLDFAVSKQRMCSNREIAAKIGDVSVCFVVSSVRTALKHDKPN